MNNILFILCYVIMAYGLSNLLVYGSGPFNILIRFREICGKRLPTLGEMLECMMCTSTNVGWVLSLLNIIILPSVPFTPFNILFNNINIWYVIIPFDAFITSGAVWLIHTCQETLESITNRNNG